MAEKGVSAMVRANGIMRNGQLAAAFLCVLITAPRAALGAAPREVPIVGVLTSTNGRPKPAGTYPVVIGLYTAAHSGALEYSESKSVTVAGNDGIFQTMLGDTTPIPTTLIFDRRYWVGITVGSDPEMTPRLPLAAVPYALMAEDIADASVTPAKIALPFGLTGSSTTGNPLISITNGGQGSVLALYSKGDPAVYSRNGAAGSGFGLPGTGAIWGDVAGGTGVFGSSSTGQGVTGLSNTGYGAQGTSVTGYSGVYGSSAHNGVYGETASTGDSGVYGHNSSSGWGVFGGSTSGYGVEGTTGSGFSGVYGTGAHNGLYGETSSATDSGVYGHNGGTGVGVTGVSASGDGVYGRTDFDGSFGIVGAVLKYSNGTQVGASIYGQNFSGIAGYFNGSVTVNGTLTKSGGSFKIDDPLDPADKYLSHSFVESPDMKNVYDGIATLDANGEAVVQLPDWFQALNRDFRYQLTCIGGYAPVYISGKVAHNQFQIAGGRSGLEVSWQVTGIRQDAWANAHRIPVEEVKPAAERGTYLHPELFGQSISKSDLVPEGR